MVVLGRLQWVRQSIMAGVSTQIMISSASAMGRGKAKILVKHSDPPISDVVQSILLAQLDCLIAIAHHFVVVDRGHRHAGSNMSEVILWFAQRAVSNAHSGLSSDHDDNHNGGQDPHDRSRPRRGRSPPSGAGPDSDPWLLHCADPWSSSAAIEGPTKAPRKRAGAKHIADDWRNYRPTHDNSVTPSPPFLRHGSDGIFSSYGLYESVDGNKDLRIMDKIASLTETVEILGRKIDDATAGLLLLANAELVKIESKETFREAPRCAPSDALPTMRCSASHLRWRRLAREAWENQREWNTLLIRSGVTFKRSAGSHSAGFAHLEDRSSLVLFGLHMRPYEHRRLNLCYVEDAGMSSSSL